MYDFNFTCDSKQRKYFAEKNIHDIVKIFEFYIEYLLAKLKEIKMCLFITFLIAYAF